MLASELIRQLQEEIDLSGDRPVVDAAGAEIVSIDVDADIFLEVE